MSSVGTPYVLPQMLMDAPLGIDWTSVGSNPADPNDNLAALIDICEVVTDLCDMTASQPIRATADTEEWEGPNATDTRWTYRENGTSLLLTNHWPVIQLVGGQFALQLSAFADNWTPIASNQMRIAQASNLLLGGSSVGSSGAEGSNMISLAPGLATSWGGRGGMVAQICYINGWPHAGVLPFATLTGDVTVNSNVISGLSSTTGLGPGASVSAPAYLPEGAVVSSVQSSSSVVVETSLTNSGGAIGALQSGSGVAFSFGYPAGVTSINVDDVTGFYGCMPRWFDGAASEGVIIASAQATNPLPVPLINGVTVNSGPGIVNLANPTTFPHSGTLPPTSLLTTIPDTVRVACYYFAAGEALVRGGTAITAPALPGSMQNTPGPPLTPAALNKEAERWIMRLGRVF